MIDPDRVIHDALNSHALPGYYWFFSAITWLGSAGLWLIILLGCIVIGRWRKIATILFIVIAFSTVVNEDIKQIVGRARPGELIVGGYYVIQSYSFPSGHAQTAFVIATVLAAFLDRRYNIITCLLAAAVCMSRIYLQVHFFTDVVVGAAVGIFLGVLAIYGLYRLGLYGGDSIFGKAFSSTEKNARKSPHDSDMRKYVAVTLAVGFIAAIVAFYFGHYILSLLVIGIMYLILLLLPSLLKKRLYANHN